MDDRANSTSRPHGGLVTGFFPEGAAGSKFLRWPIVLTEHEVSRSWRLLVGSGEMTPDVVARVEALLDELRPESPLRHRLTIELAELQTLHAARNGSPKPRSNRRKKAVVK